MPAEDHESARAGVLAALERELAALQVREPSQALAPIRRAAEAILVELADTSRLSWRGLHETIESWDPARYDAVLGELSVEQFGVLIDVLRRVLP